MYKVTAAVLIFWVVIYTLSYGAWLYKNHSKIAGISVYFVALLAAFLPVYVMFLE